MSGLFDTVIKRWTAYQAAMDEQQKGPLKVFEEIQKAMDGTDGAHTNICWEYLTLVLPQLVWTNPSLVVESQMPGEAAYDAEGLQYALEALMRQQKLSVEWEQIFSDALAWRGISMVTTRLNYAPRACDGMTLFDWHAGTSNLEDGAGREVETPHMVRLEPNDFFMDVDATSVANARFHGHSWDAYLADLEQLVDEDGEDWDMDMLESMGTQDGANHSADRPIKLVEMLVFGVLDPEAIKAHKDDEHDDDGKKREGYEDPVSSGLYTGTIYTMAEGGDGGKDVRPPRLYRGPACGPYGVYEGAPIPGKTNRMAPLAAVKNQIDTYARYSVAVLGSCEAYKSVVVTAFSEIAEIIKDAEDGDIANIDIAPQMLKDAIQALTIGGPPKELLMALDIALTGLNESLGLGQAQKGIATSGTTATAEDIAERSSSMRLAMLREGLHRTSCDQLWVMAWYMEHAPEFSIALPARALARGLKHFGVTPDPADGAVAIYTGGDALQTDRPGRGFDGKRLRFVPMSMERTSEAIQQRRSLQKVDAIARFSEMRLADPSLPMEQIANDWGDSMNIDGIGDYFAAPPSGEGQPMQPGGNISQGAEGLPGQQAGAQAAGGLV